MLSQKKKLLFLLSPLYTMVYLSQIYPRENREITHNKKKKKKKIYCLDVIGVNQSFPFNIEVISLVFFHGYG